MKKYLFLAVVFLFGCASQAQFDPEIAGYNIWIEKVNDGQTMPIPKMLIEEDITLTFSWEQGNEIGGGYITPYQVTHDTIIWVPNTSELWSGTDSTSLSQNLSFSNGMYEFTVTAVDLADNESGRSNPLFLEFLRNFARIPINFKIE